MKAARVALGAVMWMAGSAVTGTVRFDGAAPPPTRRTVTVDRKACGSDAPLDRSLVVDSSSRGIRSAVVVLENTAGGFAPGSPSSAVIEMARCEFFPYVTIVAPGAMVDVVNVDETMHAVRTIGESRGHRVLPVDAKVAVPTFQQGRTHLVCDLHYWSTAWVVATAAPFTALTGTDGSFAFPDVPPGEWTLRVWHERFGEATRSLSLGTSGRVVENVLFGPPSPP